MQHCVMVVQFFALAVMTTHSFYLYFIGDIYSLLNYMIFSYLALFLPYPF